VLIHSSPLWIILVVLLIVMVIGAIPAWPYSIDWGYAPSGMMVLVLFLVLLILFL